MALTSLSPEDFERARNKLCDELVVVHDAWDQLEYLFGSNPERLRMLNACAAWFFASLQRLLIREVLLGIARLTDNPTDGRFSNLTISTLLLDPALKGQTELKKALRAKISAALRTAAPIRVHRNKYIAHLDHAVALDRKAAPLPRLPNKTIGKAIAHLEAAYNLHGREVRNTGTQFELNSLGSARVLMPILEASARWRLFKATTQPGSSDLDADSTSATPS